MIPLCAPNISGNEWKYVKDCLDSNWISSAGSYVDKFEQNFKTYLNCESAIVTMNGTAALELALRTLGVGVGDEVIVSSMTFISPVNVIKYVGAEPVFVDICRDTFVMDVNKIEELITDKTKAILPIHIYGQAVEMDKLMKIAQKYKLYVIEDATEALGSEYKGNKLGTVGDIGCFSFNGNKLITTGSGGMLVTNNLNYGVRAKYLSTQTKTVLDNGSFYHKEIGFNFRMSNVSAAIGVAQLENINKYVNAKRKNAFKYNEILENIYGLTFLKENPDVKNCFWLYSILIEDNYYMTRDQLIKKLKENGVESRPFFQPIHLMPPYKECKHGNMKITEEISNKGINLPSSVILTEREINKVCNLIK